MKLILMGFIMYTIGMMWGSVVIQKPIFDTHLAFLILSLVIGGPICVAVDLVRLRRLQRIYENA